MASLLAQSSMALYCSSALDTSSPKSTETSVPSMASMATINSRFLSISIFKVLRETYSPTKAMTKEAAAQ
ncbi:MAG TPA: hypothetical protein PKW73_16795 [Candidatus Obscuribacter sp.]|nr:hypothetical protein [Candidatus Obscuribacter sp.]